MIQLELRQLIRTSVLAAAIAAPALGGPVGQPKPTAPANVQQPLLSRAELPVLTKLLALTRDQQEAAASLIEAYRAERDAATVPLERRMREITRERESGGGSSAFDSSDLKALGASTADRLATLDRQLVSDLQTLLTADQSTLWPRFERLRTRRAELPDGKLCGENIDLIALTDEVHLAGKPAADVQQVLDRYEIELDQAIQKRIEDRAKTAEQLNAHPASDDAKRILAEFRKIGIVVRDANDRYAAMIAAALPAAEHDEFLRRYNLAKFPRIYQESFASKSITRALAFRDLDDKQQEAIRVLRAAYERELAAANTQWAKAVVSVEKDGGGSPYWKLGMDTSGDGEASSDPLHIAAAARHDLNRATLEKLKAVLNDEQRDRLVE